MRTLLRLLALLAGFVSLPVVAGLWCSYIGYGTTQCFLAALTTLPLSSVVTLMVGSAFSRAQRTIAEVRAS